LRSAVTAARLSAAVCDKLGQLPAGTANVLVVGASTLWDAHTRGGDGDGFALGAALVALRAAAERRDTALFTRHGYRTPADFFRGFLRLSAVRLRLPWEADAPGDSAAYWPNPQAQHALPSALTATMSTL